MHLVLYFLSFLYLRNWHTATGIPLPADVVIQIDQSVIPLPQ